MRALSIASTGMAAQQTNVETIANNLANMNTTGFKASQVEFEDTLSQALKAAGAPQGAQGGTNPAQVGLGVNNDAWRSHHPVGHGIGKQTLARHRPTRSWSVTTSVPTSVSSMTAAASWIARSGSIPTPDASLLQLFAWEPLTL